MDTKNYVEVTRKWYAEATPFPLNFFLPGRMQRRFVERLQLLCGEHRPENEEELEKEVRWGGALLPARSPKDAGRGGGGQPSREAAPSGGHEPARVPPPAVPRGPGVPDPALATPGLPEVLLRRRVSLSAGEGRGLGGRYGTGAAQAPDRRS